MSASPISVCVCQMGARLHYGAARALEGRSALGGLQTDICAVKGWPSLLRAAPRAIRPQAVERLLGRVPVGIPPSKVQMFPGMGIRYQFILSRCESEAERIQEHLRAGRRFGELVAKTGFGNATHVYAFSSAALEILEAAGASGLRTVIELPSAACEFEQRIVDEERDRFLDWEPQSGRRNSIHDARRAEFAERQKQEWKKADLILVPSRFVEDSMGECGGPIERCVVVPYGVNGSVGRSHRESHDGPLRVLTVGTLSLQKGSHYGWQAATRMGNRAEFRFVGNYQLAECKRKLFKGNMRLVGSVPRSQIKAQFEWADVFLLPTLCEGMATVLIEALAAGLPIVSTRNSGMEIRNGEEGFIVPTRDPDAIVDRLDSLASEPSLLAQMSFRACQRAADFTLEAYGERLCEAIVKGQDFAC